MLTKVDSLIKGTKGNQKKIIIDYFKDKFSDDILKYINSDVELVNDLVKDMTPIINPIIETYEKEIDNAISAAFETIYNGSMKNKGSSEKIKHLFKLSFDTMQSDNPYVFDEVLKLLKEKNFKGFDSINWIATTKAQLAFAIMMVEALTVLLPLEVKIVDKEAEAKFCSNFNTTVQIAERLTDELKPLGIFGDIMSEENTKKIKDAGIDIHEMITRIEKNPNAICLPETNSVTENNPVEAEQASQTTAQDVVMDRMIEIYDATINSTADCVLKDSSSAIIDLTAKFDINLTEVLRAYLRHNCKDLIQIGTVAVNIMKAPDKYMEDIIINFLPKYGEEQGIDITKKIKIGDKEVSIVDVYNEVNKKLETIQSNTPTPEVHQAVVDLVATTIKPTENRVKVIAAECLDKVDLVIKNLNYMGVSTISLIEEFLSTNAASESELEKIKSLIHTSEYTKKLLKFTKDYCTKHKINMYSRFQLAYGLINIYNYIESAICEDINSPVVNSEPVKPVSNLVTGGVNSSKPVVDNKVKYPQYSKPIDTGSKDMLKLANCIIDKMKDLKLTAGLR